MSKKEHQGAVQARHRAWLKALIAYTGLDPTPLFDKAGVSGTSATRILNDRDYKGVLSPLSIETLKGFYGVVGPDEFAAGVPLARGFGEAEQVQLEREPDDVAAVMRPLLKGRKAADVWRLKTDSLVDAGYLPGDLVVLDRNLEPQQNDAVCVQIYDLSRGRAETVWRIYQPPFLVAAARERARYRPLIVNQDAVAIMGVIVGSARPWRASAA